MKKVLITGANGFIGKNLQLHLAELRDVHAVCFTHSDDIAQLSSILEEVDFVFHLAGVNRPKDMAEFAEGNTGLTQQLCDYIRASGRSIPVLYTSSIQAVSDNSYGVSKRSAEEALVALERDTGSPVYIYRLPNVFGKLSRPNYNSVVATFCYNIANGLAIQINDPSAQLCLVYIDDVIEDFLGVLEETPVGVMQPKICPEYSVTVGDLANKINGFKDGGNSMGTELVSADLTAKLYETYLSFLRTK